MYVVEFFNHVLRRLFVAVGNGAGDSHHQPDDDNYSKNSDNGIRDCERVVSVMDIRSLDFQLAHAAPVRCFVEPALAVLLDAAQVILELLTTPLRGVRKVVLNGAQARQRFTAPAFGACLRPIFHELICSLIPVHYCTPYDAGLI
jgi:hypothetical protein